jgi:PPOX class probable F420-dependent enzyme
MSESYFAPLAGAEFVVLTTFRASGIAVPTTVWFAASGPALYVTTQRHAGKVKRVRASGSVLVAPSDRVGNVQGAALEAHARELAPEDHEAAAAALRAKYGPMYDEITGRSDPSARTFIVITPP